MMLNLLTSFQTRRADLFTIESHSITALDLMEAAAHAFVQVFLQEFPDYDTPVSVYCGTGNNGGDGLAIARLLKTTGYKNISVRIAFFNTHKSPDFEANLDRLACSEIKHHEIDAACLPDEPAPVIIDALLGSGLNKPLTGKWKLLVDFLNNLQRQVVAVDVPTGFPSEGMIDTAAPVLKAGLVITFQRAKINFFFPESAYALDRFRVADIGLNEGFIQAQTADFKLMQEEDISKILMPRKPFSHKGTYGHALIIAGKAETMGAALLCAGACLHTGAGLTTACIPPGGLTALNTRLPEIMAVLRDEQEASLPELKKYTAIAAGPGLGTDKTAKELIGEIINADLPLILDADALTLLSQNPGWLERLPAGTILTPHMKEFDRLFGNHPNWWQRLETAREQAAKLSLIIVLKNRYTFLVAPGKPIYINPTGSPAMASGGMGDVLTGMIVSFLAQAYAAEQAVTLATYIHGLCGERFNGYTCTATALVKMIPLTMESLIRKN